MKHVNNVGQFLKPGLTGQCTQVVEDICRSGATMNRQVLCGVLRGIRHAGNWNSSNMCPILTQCKFRHTGPSRLSYVHGPSDTPLVALTFGQALRQAVDKYGDREMFVFCHQGVRKSFAQFQKEVATVASGLLSLGLEKGDRVGIWSPNHYEWVLTQFATAAAGMILVNVNPVYGVSELEYALNKVNVRALVCSTELKTYNYYDILSILCPELATSAAGDLQSRRVPDLKTVFMMGEQIQPGTFKFSDLSQMGGSDHVRRLEELHDEVQCDDPVNIQFTSGTTGYPKGVALSHHSLLNNAFFCGRAEHYYKEGTRFCGVLPLYHTGMCAYNVLQTVMHGATVVFPSAIFDSGTALKTIQEERCTAMVGVPTMFRDLVNHPNRTDYDLSSLKYGLIGGSLVLKSDMKMTIKELDISCISMGYGTTETSPVLVLQSADDPPEVRLDPSGKAIDHMEIKIANENGAIVPINTPGEVCARGFSIMLGYWDDEAQTKKAIGQDRWYKTGDIGTMDENGNITLIGRSTDMVIRGGENIYAAEVEEFLRKIPDIIDAQVIGVPDRRMQEEVCAWIKLKEGSNMTVDDVREYCKGKITFFKIPRYILIVDEYPLTVTNKIRKHVMQEESIKILGLENQVHEE